MSVTNFVVLSTLGFFLAGLRISDRGRFMAPIDGASVGALMFSVGGASVGPGVVGTSYEKE